LTTSQQIELLCIGNELLIGKTLNTNAQWLAKRITSLGLAVSRITVVADNINEISSAIQEAIKRNPAFLLTTGGLGPTFDDKTLEGLAEALGQKTEINQEALKMVKEKYQNYAKQGKMDAAELTPHRVKMARLPKGATPLSNPVGSAPAVSITHKNVTIISFPGVPSEMKGIFDDSVAPMIKQSSHGMNFFETSIISKNVMESEMAPIIDVVMTDNPRVYIKSHPKGTETAPFIEFHLSTTDKDTSVAKNRVNKALDQLKEAIKAKSGTIKPMKPEA
jgi:nicotinamide-nucleotide amidase